MPFGGGDLSDLLVILRLYMSIHREVAELCAVIDLELLSFRGEPITDSAGQ